MNLDVEATMKCIKLCYEEGMEYKGKIYKLKSGAPTGHPISSAIQNIVLSTYETEIYKKYIKSGSLRMYHRWVDDTICIVKSSEKYHLLQELNSLDPTKMLKFTMEESTTESGVNCIAFLDLKIRWGHNLGKFTWSTEVFRKATTSDVMKPFTEFGPENWKTGTLVWFLRRAVTHSSTMKLMDLELNHLRTCFSRVGYPHWLISNKIQKTISVMLGYEKKEVKVGVENKSDRWIVLHLPYSGKAANDCLKKIRYLLPVEKCRVTIAYSTTKFRSLLPKFTPQHGPSRRDPLEVNNCVYKYLCQCGMVYIGETLRRLDIRASEHSRNTEKSRSPMMTHINSCKNEFQKTNFTIVSTGLKGSSARKKYESIFIEFYKKSHQCMNICEKSKVMSIF